jgi:hypothetical protein
LILFKNGDIDQEVTAETQFIGVQAKAYKKEDERVNPIGEILRAKGIFRHPVSKTQFTEMWVVTTANITGPQKVEADANDVKIINYNSLKSQVKEILTSPKATPKAEPEAAPEPQKELTRDDKIRKLSAEGLSQRKIAARLGVGIGTVGRALKKEVV